MRKKVERFSKVVIRAHWVNAAAFFFLYFTGLGLYTESFDWVYVLFGGAAGARIAHRIAGVIFFLPTIYVLVKDPKSIFHWLKQAFTWRKNDFLFFIHFPIEFFGGHSKKMPKQDFYNAGEKLNSLLTVFCAIILATSGLLMWFPQFFPQGLVHYAYLMHSIGFGVGIAVVVGHVFLSMIHPGSKISMKGMTQGDVPIEYIKDHHGRWFDELKEQGIITEEDEKNMRTLKK